MRRLTRSWLQGREPDYASRLESCWDIAFNEWLPAVDVNKGSFNSFPHLRNLEMYLDEILFAGHPNHPESLVIDALGITPSEVYVMLCAILFHDLGRSYKGTFSHACESRITLAQHYKDLGLESEELALCIGRICHFHDPEETVDKRVIITGKASGAQESLWPVRLSNVTITGYGVIRERLLGALLVLIDHLDGTYGRVLPHYVRANEFGEIGKFRARIPGIRVDLMARMVVTAVKTSGADTVNNTTISDPLKIVLNNKAPELRGHKLPKAPFTMRRSGAKQKESRLEELLNALTRKWRHACTSKQSNYLLALGRSIKGREGAAHILIARNVAFISNQSNQPIQNRHRLLLATIAGNTLENARALSDISGTLQDYGIPLYAWLLECDEHLYTCFGIETYEPLLSEDFLGRLAQAMWNKTTRVFGRGVSTYEGLASDLREASIERVRMGVRRLAIVTLPKGSIHALQDGWHWNTQDLSLQVLIKDFIGKLVRPNSHIHEDPNGGNSNV
jgi:hypothetical protein